LIDDDHDDKKIMAIKRLTAIIFLFLGAVVGFAQNITLDTALKNTTLYLVEKLPPGTLVVVLNFSSKHEELSTYVIEELTANLVNNGKLTVVDRQNLDTIQKEMQFQMSGEVSDESAQAIGKKLGAQTIISGSIDALGNIFRLRVRAIEVQTAAIQGMQTLNVVRDQIVEALTGGAANVAVSTAPKASQGVPPSSDITGKPIKKTPTRKGNFEVIQGRSVNPPLNVDKFSQAVDKAVGALGNEYRIIQQTPGITLLRFTDSGLFASSRWVQIKVCYWDDEYWFEYVNSFKFDANPGRDTIHGSYRDAINDLEAQITKFYR
jgi:TolB-like protein